MDKVAIWKSFVLPLVMGLRSSASICVGFGKQTFDPSF